MVPSGGPSSCEGYSGDTFWILLGADDGDGDDDGDDDDDDDDDFGSIPALSIMILDEFCC